MVFTLDDLKYRRRIAIMACAEAGEHELRDKVLPKLARKPLSTVWTDNKYVAAAATAFGLAVRHLPGMCYEGMRGKAQWGLSIPEDEP